MRSVECQCYYNLAKKIDSRLRADDPRFERAVRVCTYDGANLFYENAFLMRKDNWIFLFAEHHQCEVFSYDDLRLLNEYYLSQDILEEVGEEFEVIKVDDSD